MCISTTLQEHQAWFFVHGCGSAGFDFLDAPRSSGHSQWEAPKCLADLGWSWAYGASELKGYTQVDRGTAADPR